MALALIAAAETAATAVRGAPSNGWSSQGTYAPSCVFTWSNILLLVSFPVLRIWSSHTWCAVSGVTRTTRSAIARRDTEPFVKRTLLGFALFGLPVVIIVVGQSAGWWQLSRHTEVFGVAAAVAIAGLLFVPAFKAAERMKRANPGIYWVVVVAALLVTGCVALAADKWLAGRGVP